jgi:deazaflavin-dependent oxidoreductase (nitroreductase family)
MKIALTTTFVAAALGLLQLAPARGGTMPSTHVDLTALAKERTLEITTVGRKSGKRRTVEVWFVAENDHVFVQAGVKGRKGWLANVRSDPEVGLDIAGTKLHGHATIVNDEAERKRIIEMFRHKYWLAWAASWVGSGIGAGIPVRINIEP